MYLVIIVICIFHKLAGGSALYQSLEHAEAAAVRVSEGIRFDPHEGESLSPGIPIDIARYLAARGGGFDDWAALEAAYANNLAIAPVAPEQSVANLVGELEPLRIWDHPVGVEGFLHSDDAIRADPEKWIDECISLILLTSSQIGRYEAATSVFDYVRSEAPYDLDDIELTTHLAIAMGVDADKRHLMNIKEAMQRPEYRHAAHVFDIMISFDFSLEAEDSDFVEIHPDRMAICTRAGRLGFLVKSMGPRELSAVLKPCLKHIAAAGGGVTAGETLIRLCANRLPPHLQKRLDKHG